MIPALPDPLPARSPSAFHLLAKPTGARCNLNCSYCFFLDKSSLYPGSDLRMTEAVLEQYIRQLFESHRVECVNLAWQGGEPTLMGLDFYRRAIELTEQYRPKGVRAIHSIQTNGTLLDDEWAIFLKKHDFLVGISLDGPRELHDTYRRDKKGRPTFDAVMNGLRLLQEHGVEHNVLATVNRVNAESPKEVYRFLRDEAGATWIQFIPVVERIDGNGDRLYQEGTRVSDRSVLPSQYGRFLISTFDEWVRHDVGRVFVQTFEATVNNWLGMGSSGMCVFNQTCGAGPALEHNGDLYSCDHYVEPRFLLGNITERHMVDLMASPSQLKFGLDKLATLPGQCLKCDVLFACHGECPKNRFITTAEGEPGLNYLCDGMKAFFHHVAFPMKLMGGLIRRGREAREVMDILDRAFENISGSSPCPCGSGRPYGECHVGL